MEYANILDLKNSAHLFSLHYVFLPYIQLRNTWFMGVHRHHKLRTENHRSPQTMYDMSRLIYDPAIALQDQVDENYALDPEIAAPSLSEAELDHDDGGDLLHQALGHYDRLLTDEELATLQTAIPVNTQVSLTMKELTLVEMFERVLACVNMILAFREAGGGV